MIYVTVVLCPHRPIVHDLCHQREILEVTRDQCHQCGHLSESVSCLTYPCGIPLPAGQFMIYVLVVVLCRKGLRDLFHLSDNSSKEGLHGLCDHYQNSSPGKCGASSQRPHDCSKATEHCPVGTAGAWRCRLLPEPAGGSFPLSRQPWRGCDSSPLLLMEEPPSAASATTTRRGASVSGVAAHWGWV